MISSPVDTLRVLQQDLREFAIRVADITPGVMTLEGMLDSKKADDLREDVAFQVAATLCDLNRLEHVLLGVGTSVHDGNISGGHQDLSHALQDLSHALIADDDD